MERLLVALAATAIVLALLVSMDGDAAEAAWEGPARRSLLEQHRTDDLGRHFWRPAHSDAQPPGPRIGRCHWHPRQGRTGRCVG